MPDQEPQPYSELASFGEELRREREIRGISLREIADATKISKRYLEAIERNDHRTLPAPVFTRGFVREYARYLGLNSEEIVNRYNFAAAGDDRIEKPPQLDRTTPPLVSQEKRLAGKKRGIPPVWARIDGNFVLLVLIAAALAGVAWWAVKNKRFDLERYRGESVPPPTYTGRPAAVPVPVIPGGTTTAGQEGGLHLTLEITEDSFILLEVDGEKVVDTVLSAGASRTLEAKREFRFRTIGNAAGVKLTLNDKPLPPLGESGEVIKDRVYDQAFVDTLDAESGTPQ